LGAGGADVLGGRRAAAAWVAWFLQHPRLESSLASPAEIHKLVNIDLYGEGNVQT